MEIKVVRRGYRPCLAAVAAIGKTSEVFPVIPQETSEV